MRNQVQWYLLTRPLVSQHLLVYFGLQLHYLRLKILDVALLQLRFLNSAGQSILRMRAKLSSEYVGLLMAGLIVMSRTKKHIGKGSSGIASAHFGGSRIGEGLGGLTLGEEYRQIERYVGVSIGGGKSENTAMAVIDYYVKQNKAFVIDVFSNLGPENESSADEVFIELMKEMAGDAKLIAFDAPISLPPCAAGCLQQCKKVSACPKKEVQNMWQLFAREKKENSRIKPITPYSQRLVDLYYKYAHSQLEPFQDETMGANMAPKAVRVQFLLSKLQITSQVHEKKKKKGRNQKKVTREIVEVWPKLALYAVANKIDLKPKEALGYKNLEGGVQIRDKIVHELQELGEIFIYERDIKKVVDNLPSFDALICAWVALLTGQGRVEKDIRHLSEKFSWIKIPQL